MVLGKFLKICFSPLSSGYSYIILLIFPGFCWSQYLPLDVAEMKSRVSASPINFEKNDSNSLAYSYDIGMTNENQVSLFITPSFRIAINNNFRFFYRIFATSNPNYGPRIGSRYERSGEFTGPKKPGDLSVMESYFQGNYNTFHLKLGKFSPWMDSGTRFNIEQNYKLPSIYGLEYIYEIEHLKYSHGHYWLGYSSQGDFAEGYSRFFASQHLTLSWKYGEVSIGNKVIYSGLNQTMNWRYWAPFEPFIISVFNFGAPENNDNHAINVSLILRPNSNIQLLAKLIIDEFEVDAADRKTNDDDFGYQISSIINIDNAHLQSVALNYMYSSDYLGIHYGPSTNFEVEGLPLFSEYGPQTKRLEIVNNFIWEWQNTEGWVAIYRQSKGRNQIVGTPWSPKANRVDKESWDITIGLEAEILIPLFNDCYAFTYINIAEKNDVLCKLAVAYSFHAK